MSEKTILYQVTCGTASPVYLASSLTEAIEKFKRDNLNLSKETLIKFSSFHSQ